MRKLAKQEAMRWHEEDVADVILKYLAEQPQASDTLKGIAEWWIMRQQVRVEVNTLDKVLRQLTENGVLKEFGEGDNRQYRLKAKEYAFLRAPLSLKIHK